MSTEQRQIEATIAGLEALRPHLGDALVDAALAPLRQRLDALNGAAGGASERQALRQVSVLFMEVIALCRLAEIDLEAGCFDEARAAFADAHALALASDDPLRFDAAAGLARVALARDDVDAAMAALAETIARIEAGDPLDSTESRQLIRLTCYVAMQRAGDPRGDAILRSAHDELVRRAALLADDAMRTTFIEQIPEHRAIVAAWPARAG